MLLDFAYNPQQDQPGYLLPDTSSRSLSAQLLWQSAAALQHPLSEWARSFLTSQR